MLVGGIDRDLYVPRPQIEHALSRSLAAGRNVLLVGPPGSGKSTALRKLTADLRDDRRRHLLVLASTARTTEELLALIRSELFPLGLERAVADDLRTGASRGQHGESTVLTLIDAVRTLDRVEDTVIMLDGPLSPEIVHELFGRLREELWGLPHQWVLALRNDQSAAARKPPADAFFPEVIELPPLQRDQVDDLLDRALTDEELLRVQAALTSPDARASADLLNGVHYPRDVVNLAHRALAGKLDSSTGELRRRELAAGAGRSTLVALAEMEALRRPISAGDAEFLERTGWTEAHARRLLAQMEHIGLVSSIADTTAATPGRPRKLYVLKIDV